MNAHEKYYEYWRMDKAPFDNVPDPEMFFEMHASVGEAVAETLFAIEEGNECLVVIVGDVGLGKTMALRVVLDSLDSASYRIVFIANPDLDFTQIMREIIGQLKEEECHITAREQLLETFNQILFDPDDTRKVLLFIDEGNALKPENLESLRLLTNMQRDDENVLTIILAGQLELARTLEKPEHANLFQRVGVYCRLEKVDSADLVRDYVGHRLERAGREAPIFTDGACEALLECSENGVPRLINKLAKLSLKAGQTHGLSQIDGTIVRKIASRFQRTMPLPPPEPAADVSVPSPVPAADVSVPPQTLPTPAPTATPALVLTVEEPSSSSLVADTASAVPDKEEPSVASEAAPPDEPAEPVQVTIAEFIQFSDDEYERATSLDKNQQERVAGQMAAKVLKQHPELVQKLGQGSDPIPAWNVLRMAVMHQIELHQVVPKAEEVGEYPA